MSHAIFEFTGKFSAEDLPDVVHLTRPRFYWVRDILESWHGLALLVALAWATILAIAGRTNPVWGALGVIWAVVVVIIGWSMYSAKRDRMRALEQLNETLPDTLAFTTEGVTWTRAGGTRSLLQWRQFVRWRERPRVMVLDQADGLVVIPIAHLPETERQRLRDFLRSHISTPTRAH